MWINLLALTLAIAVSVCVLVVVCSPRAIATQGR